ncbi:two-component sensor histidine kinase [Corallococcus sp. H22C18031201]|nr:two-component sensor histidine kinase [Corallococcus sp. H22C18031201]
MDAPVLEGGPGSRETRAALGVGGALRAGYPGAVPVGGCDATETPLPERSAPWSGAGREARAAQLLTEHLVDVRRRTDRVFAWLLLSQWVSGIGVAWLFSTPAWVGRARPVHPGVVLALGLVLSALPMGLSLVRPGTPLTRHVVALSQVSWSALLIHLTGGRIETHFHLFGSLAFLVLYRDVGVLLGAGSGVLLEQGLLEVWGGQAAGAQGGVLEHGFWVGFTVVGLTCVCRAMVREMRQRAVDRADLEHIHAQEQRAREVALEQARGELRHVRERVARIEKLATLGQHTASVSHELRNPLAAARTAHAYVTRRLTQAPGSLDDTRVRRFLDIIDRELAVCARLTSELLDCARERPLQLQPCQLRLLVDEVLDVISPREGVRIHNAVPESLPAPLVDREYLRQVLINLVQNAIEAFPLHRLGDVTVLAAGGGLQPWHIRVVDNGPGIPAEVLPRIFDPLFTTKVQGTGLGLSIVANAAQRLEARISVRSEEGRGTEFTLELPPLATVPAQ